MKITEFNNVPVNCKVRRRKWMFAPAMEVESMTYRKLMKLIGDCIAQGGHVDFEHKEGKVSAKLHWPE